MVLCLSYGRQLSSSVLLLHGVQVGIRQLSKLKVKKEAVPHECGKPDYGLGCSESEFDISLHNEKFHANLKSEEYTLEILD